MKRKFKVGNRVVYTGSDNDWAEFSPGVVVNGKYGLGVRFDNYDYCIEPDYHDTPPWHDLEFEQQKTPDTEVSEVTKGYDLSEYTKLNPGQVKKVFDQVNSPSHYGQGSIECIDYIEDVLTREEFIGYLRGNLIKYHHRFRYKGKPEQDLGKANWYLEKLRTVIEKE